ncbi:MAG: hypothetical protein Q7T55_17245, partial [Solirubrobacteraceae bacterium]|nr:hypothetical protein [Solirubrobacteraceae bacterium]
SAPLGTIFEVASRRWDHGEYPTAPGEHQKVPLSNEAITKIDNGYGLLVPVDLTVSLLVSRQRYVGQVPIDKLHGLRDEHTGQVIANAFEFRLLDPVRIQNDWIKLGEDEEPPYPVVLEVQGLHCWGPK